MFRFRHLLEINMTYWNHFLFSGSLSIKLMKGSMQALLHAIYPDLFVTSTSELVEYLSNELNSNKLREIANN
jgi:hypothetical protein